jgi:hypothetical protein
VHVRRAVMRWASQQIVRKRMLLGSPADGRIGKLYSQQPAGYYSRDVVVGVDQFVECARNARTQVTFKR